MLACVDLALATKRIGKVPALLPIAIKIIAASAFQISASSYFYLISDISQTE